MKIALAMSGGVDSSVALHILLEKGYEVVGVHMKTFPDEYFSFETRVKKKVCCGPSDTRDAHRIATEAGVPFKIINLGELFSREVVERFLSMYRGGYTPNPCVFCNRYVKMGALLDYAIKNLNCQKFATGHYARVEYVEDLERWLIKRAVDLEKDQSYFLSLIKSERLPYLLLPLGEWKKANIREKARELGLHVFDKTESQEICFVPEDDVSSYLKEKLGSRRGAIKTLDGKVVGEHEGYFLYTVGQRKGLKIHLGKRVYVHHVDPMTNTVYVAEREKLLAGHITAFQPNYFLPPQILTALSREETFRCKVRSKSNMLAVASLECTEDRLKLTLKEPAFAVTPGQVLAVYWKDYLVAGAIIEEWEAFERVE